MNSLMRSACRFPASRCFSTSQCRSIRDLKKLKELQKPFQVDDGVPIFLKKGPTDKLIFGLISAYTVVVCICGFHFAYTMAFPPKPS